MSLVCEPSAPAYPHKCCDVLRGIQGSYTTDNHTSLLYHHKMIWDLTLLKSNFPMIHSFSPPLAQKTELITVPDSDLWASKGGHYIFHCIDNRGMKSFQMLNDEFALPNFMLVCYLQLHHALQAQSTDQYSVPIHIFRMEVIAGGKLISTCYNILRTTLASQVAYSPKPHWESDAGRVSDYFFLHRSYLTPICLSKFYPMNSLLCPMCSIEPGTFSNHLWTCPKIQVFWSQVEQFLQDKMGSLLPLNHKCLLGLYLDRDSVKFMTTFIHLIHS